MRTTLASRLDQILPRITSKAFLSSEGIGNEIACYIFDYPAEDELKVREHLAFMMERFRSHHPDLRVLHLNLLDLVIAYLEKRGLLDKALAMQAKKGDAGVLSALRGPLAAEKLRDFIAEEHSPSEQDLVLMSGVGECLADGPGAQPSQLPAYDSGERLPRDVLSREFRRNDLRLFGTISTATTKAGTKPYYRAFTLVPSGKDA